MNSLSRGKTLGLAAVMIFVFTIAACAQLPEADHAKMGKKWEERFSEVIKELNLTPEQQTAITQQRTEERSRSQELRRMIKDVRDQVTQELNKDVTDTAKLDQLVVRLKELTAQRIEQQIQGIVLLKKVLTPEQFKALNEKTKREQRHKGDKK